MTRSSYSRTVNTHVTSTATKTEKVNHPQNSPTKSSKTSIPKDTVHISQEARKAYESSAPIVAINPVRNTIENTVYNPIDFIKREASRNLGNQTEIMLYNPVKNIKDALQSAVKPFEKDTVQISKEVREAFQQSPKSNDIKKAKEEALTRQIQLSLYNMDKNVRTVVVHNLSQDIYTASKNKSNKGWSAAKELIDVVTDFVPVVGTIKDAYRLYQVLSNPKSNAKDVAEALVGFIPGLGDLKNIAKVTNAIKKGFDIDPKKLDQAVSIIKGTGKPLQKHHYATDKSKKYTPQIEAITKKYGLDLDDVWNIELLPHQGRHPDAYHEYVLSNIRTFDKIAKGDKRKFLRLFEQLKQEIRKNPEMLYKDYWRKK